MIYIRKSDHPWYTFTGISVTVSSELSIQNPGKLSFHHAAQQNNPFLKVYLLREQISFEGHVHTDRSEPKLNIPIIRSIKTINFRDWFKQGNKKLS